MRRHVVVVVQAVLMCMLLAGCMTDPGPLVALSIEPTSGYSPLLVRLAADEVSMEEPISYEWTLGDGSTADGLAVEREFVGKGSIFVRLVVTDALGQQAAAEGAVLLLNRIPHAQFTYQPYKPPIHQPVRFDSAGSFDPDGEIVSYRWDFGDGSTAEGERVEHAFETPNITYRVVLTVIDDSGDENDVYRFVDPIGCDH